MPHKKGNRWLADWRDSRGIRKRRSFKLKADASAHEKEMREARQKKTPITAAEIFGPIETAARERKDHHGRLVARMLIEELGNLEADKITAQQITNLQARWHTEGYAQTTIREYSLAIRRVLREATPNCPHAYSLLAKVKREKLAPVRDVTASEAELDLLLEHAHPGLQLAILLCHDSGVRIAEACRITPAGTNLDTRETHFIQKGNRPRSAQLTERTASAMRAANPDPLEPFVTNLWPKNFRQSNEPVRKGTVQIAFRALKKKLHMRPELHIHDLRRTLATNAFSETKDLRVPQALLAHDSIATTARYIAPQLNQDHRDLLELLAARSKWTPSK